MRQGLRWAFAFVLGTAVEHLAKMWTSNFVGNSDEDIADWEKSIVPVLVTVVAAASMLVQTGVRMAEVFEIAWDS